MSHSYNCSHIHYIFSTKNRGEFITPELEEQLWRYMGDIARKHQMKAFLKKHRIAYDDPDGSGLGLIQPSLTGLLMNCIFLSPTNKLVGYCGTSLTGCYPGVEYNKSVALERIINAS